MISRKDIEKIQVFDGMNPESVYQSVEHHLKYLPERFHEEFVIELLCESGPQSPNTIRKNWEMYWENIFDELTVEERQIVYKDLLMFEIPC